ncbi:kanamycin nucleotidyltransferase C-terminal domain-containing protein [Paenibacillus sp. yr247]|uniref:kanamycin nucleotidyltransferase C-terminal domain-containing protein n=1 Tax=Paenibacillus sp. yr247 TaxID=1761880 RepID=UPI0011407CC3
MFLQWHVRSISFNSLESVKVDIEEVDYEWCAKSDAVFTFKVIHDPTNLHDELKKIATISEKNANFNALVKAAMADMYEHVYKIFSLSDEDSITAAHEARLSA